MTEYSSLIPQRQKQKGMRDKPMIHDELKHPRSISLTDTAVSIADNLQKSHGFSSRGEILEFLLRVFPAIPEQAICQAICATYGKGEPGRG